MSPVHIVRAFHGHLSQAACVGHNCSFNSTGTVRNDTVSQACPDWCCAKQIAEAVNTASFAAATLLPSAKELPGMPTLLTEFFSPLRPPCTSRVVPPALPQARTCMSSALRDVLRLCYESGGVDESTGSQLTPKLQVCTPYFLYQDTWYTTNTWNVLQCICPTRTSCMLSSRPRLPYFCLMAVAVAILKFSL